MKLRDRVRLPKHGGRVGYIIALSGTDQMCLICFSEDNERNKVISRWIPQDTAELIPEPTPAPEKAE